MTASRSAIRPLLASYGGGHAHIIATVGRALLAADYDVNMIGFTTAYRALERANLPVKSIEDLLIEDEDRQYIDEIQKFLPSDTHPDVSDSETEAYFALGFRDLCEGFGKAEAIERTKSLGRKAFEPVSSMERYLRKTQPDVVITTTSPRFELAMLKAARNLGIPSVAIGDWFLIQEREWILNGEYAAHLCVLTESMVGQLLGEGLKGTRLHVTGNPAFDMLALQDGNMQRRIDLRKEMGAEGKTVILWPAAGSEAAMGGQKFATPEEVVEVMEAVCRTNPEYFYVMRPHPNNPFEMPDAAMNGILSPAGLSAEDGLLMADLVCVEVSTMGLQAALIGKPVICVGFADYVNYPKYGLATAADTLDEMAKILIERSYSGPTDLDMPPLGTATENVVKVIESVLKQVV